jgi:hypothetical protein
VAAVLLVCLAVAGANYYMDLGWFGQYGRLLVSVSLLLVCISLMVAQQMWRKDQ